MWLIGIHAETIAMRVGRGEDASLHFAAGPKGAPQAGIRLWMRLTNPILCKLS
jgi:hypothetical protein